MKIYTYYQNLNDPNQDELIDLWKISWSRQGYEPIVLNLEDAKKHSFFETLNSEMRRIFKEITNKEIGDYGMSCWFRWLAYATQSDEKFYVSDYDAINVNFPITEPNEKLHLMDDHVPFLVSGTPKQFENLCKAFVEVSNQRIDILKQQTDHYHDQEFFMFNFMSHHNDSAEDLRNKHNILMTRDRSKFGGFYDPEEDGVCTYHDNFDLIKKEKYNVTHISNYMTHLLKKKYKKYENKSAGKLRIDLVKELLESK